jgi:hypothetical protein
MYTELPGGLEYHCRITLSGNSLRYIVRNMSSVKSIWEIPKDSDRVDVGRREIDTW